MSKSDKLHFPQLLSPGSCHMIGYKELRWHGVTSSSALHDGGVQGRLGTLTASVGVQFIVSLNYSGDICQWMTLTEILATEYLMKSVARKLLPVLK